MPRPSKKQGSEIVEGTAKRPSKDCTQPEDNDNSEAVETESRENAKTIELGKTDRINEIETKELGETTQSNSLSQENIKQTLPAEPANSEAGDVATAVLLDVNFGEQLLQLMTEQFEMVTNMKQLGEQVLNKIREQRLHGMIREQVLNGMTREQVLNGQGKTNGQIDLEPQVASEWSQTNQGRARTCKCPTFNGETDWTTFMAQFEAWMRLNACSDDDDQVRSDLLSLALDGEAKNVYSSLNKRDRTDYKVLVAKLETRYGDNVAETFKAKLLGARERHSGESISKLRDSLWMIARKAYPTLSAEAQDQIAMDALLRSVEPELRIQCIMQECKTLDKAVDIMERYETVIMTEVDGKKVSQKSRTTSGVYDSLATQ